MPIAMMERPSVTRVRTASEVRTLSISAIAMPTRITGRISAPAPMSQCVPVEMTSPTGPATSNQTEPPMTAASPMRSKPHASAWVSNVLWPPKRLSRRGSRSRRSPFAELSVRSSGMSRSSSHSSSQSSRLRLGLRVAVSSKSDSCLSRRKNEPTPRAAAPSEWPTTLYADPTRSSAVSAATFDDVGGCVMDTGPP